MGGRLESKPFKESFNREAALVLAENLCQVVSFDTEGFVADVCAPLDELELKARVEHAAACMREYLPPDPAVAIEALAKLAEVWRPPDGHPYPGFVAWPVFTFIGRYGVEAWDVSLRTLARLTHLFSAEFAIREFIGHDPEAVWRYLTSWRGSASEHVRRLVSEGTRSQLPWGRKVGFLTSNPEKVIRLIAPLRADSSEYVRRSVANNLNDISKHHPKLVVDACGEWLQTDSDPPERVVRHALRSLIKKGYPPAMELLGYATSSKLRVVALIADKSARIGESLRFSFRLESLEDREIDVVVDYRIHFVKKTGSTSPKVFKLKVLRLLPPCESGNAQAALFGGPNHSNPLSRRPLVGAAS